MTGFSHLFVSVIAGLLPLKQAWCWTSSSLSSCKHHFLAASLQCQQQSHYHLGKLWQGQSQRCALSVWKAPQQRHSFLWWISKFFSRNNKSRSCFCPPVEEVVLCALQHCWGTQKCYSEIVDAKCNQISIILVDWFCGLLTKCSQCLIVFFQRYSVAVYLVRVFTATDLFSQLKLNSVESAERCRERSKCHSCTHLVGLLI